MANIEILYNNEYIIIFLSLYKKKSLDINFILCIFYADVTIKVLLKN